jgi:4-diphosphocytidyl-2-C-methyl-D-erythritol kinase
VSAAVERGSSDAPSYRLVAPAKLTVSLRITGTRPGGYHLIDAEMVSLDLVDELTLHERDEFGDDGLEIVLFAEAMGSRGFAVEAGDDNLVRKALAVANRRAHVRLAKRIPAGAGLGGGSSDAAAVLRWAGVTDLVAAGRRRGVLPRWWTGPGARHRRDRRAAPVRAADLHTVDAALWLLDSGGLSTL